MHIKHRYTTSEANVFGATHSLGDWYDGEVNKIDIGRNEKEIHTSQVRETVRVSDSCSKRSYYETLTERYFRKNFSSSHLSTSPLGSRKKILCPDTYQCIGQTLTFKYPTCNSSHSQKALKFDELLRCSLLAVKVVKEEMENDAGKYSKSCTIKEFFVHQVNEGVPYKREKHFNYPGSIRGNTGFGLDFKMAWPRSANNQWAYRSIKTLHQEYYIMTEIGLIGTVGGTLGLFVGLSFTGCGTVMMRLIKWVLSGMVAKKNQPKRK